MKKEYRKYLKSKEWKSIKKKIRRRDKNQCRICFYSKNLNVHHMTYRRIFKENCNDLILLCKRCHDKLHKISKSKGINYFEAFRILKNKFRCKIYTNEQIEREDRESEKDEHRKKYYDYINSEEWKIKRAQVIERDGGRCRACLSNKYLNIHHLTYDRVFNESLNDLITVCHECHCKIHDLGKSGMCLNDAIIEVVRINSGNKIYYDLPANGFDLFLNKHKISLQVSRRVESNGFLSYYVKIRNARIQLNGKAKTAFFKGITPEIAIENLMESISGGVIVLNESDKIIQVPEFL